MSKGEGTLTLTDAMKLLEQGLAPSRKAWAAAEKAGFFPLHKQDSCGSTEHQPPSHIVIPDGMGYRHVCPNCGQVTEIHNRVTF